MIGPEFNNSEVVTYMVALGVYAMAFSHAVRLEVYRRQHGDCAMCGKHQQRLETHHILPHCLGGTDEEDNAVGLCHDDHLFADRMALRHHIFYPDCLLYDREMVGLANNE